MECDVCSTEMELEEVVTDYYDPNDKYGHGQYSETVWWCPKCENVEPYIKEEYDERV